MLNNIMSLDKEDLTNDGLEPKWLRKAGGEAGGGAGGGADDHYAGCGLNKTFPRYNPPFLGW